MAKLVCLPYNQEVRVYHSLINGPKRDDNITIRIATEVDGVSQVHASLDEAERIANAILEEVAKAKKAKKMTLAEALEFDEDH